MKSTNKTSTALAISLLAASLMLTAWLAILRTTKLGLLGRVRFKSEPCFVNPRVCEDLSKKGSP